MNKDIFLDSIRPGSIIDYNFCMKIYGYDITYPGFASIALNKIEGLGLVEIKKFYDSSVKQYEDSQKECMKNLSEYFFKECLDEYERNVKEWKSKNTQWNNYLTKQKESSLDKLKRLKKLL